MPGIFGVIDRDSHRMELAPERLEICRRMAAAMYHEADYVTDIVASPSLGACAGRVGWAYGGRVAGTSGEALECALLATGEPMLDGPEPRGADGGCRAIGFGAAVLARAIRLGGIAALKDIDGACSGFLMDPPGGRCVLFNDRYGVERLFLHTNGTRLYFSSEANAIRAVVPSATAVDPQGLAEWLSLGCTIGGQSLFKAIEILDGGTALTFHANREAIRTRYFDREQLELLPQLSHDQFVEEFTASLVSAANSAVSRSPAALSLTGGLDSRLVIAGLDAAPQTMPCYTFGSMYRLTMDASVAARVAASCNQPHQVLELDKGFLTGIDDCFRRAVFASDGYLGLAGGAELYLNRLARSVAPARVTGNWGGELMRGVRAFKFRMPKGDFIRSPIRELLPDVAKRFDETTGWHPLSYTLFQQMPHQGFGRYAVERSQVQMRSPFLANRVVKALYQSSTASRSSLDVVSRVLARRPGLLAVPTDTGRLGQSTRLVGMLRQAHRRVMVKAEYLTSHGAPDWMAGVSARVPFVETAFLGRDKFQHFRYWIRHELSDFVRSTLRRDDTGVLSEWFDMRRLSTMVEDHIAGRTNYTDELDKVMTVAVMQSTVNRGNPSPVSPAAKHHQEVSLAMSAPL